MAEVHWMPGIITLAFGILLGIICFLLVRRKGDATAAGDATSEGSSPTSTQMALDDLRQEKARLMRALRDLEDRGDSGEQARNERRELELRAATVFKALHEAETATTSSSGAVPGGAGPGTPAAAGAGPFAAFKWIAVGAFFPLVAISLYFATSERIDDMTPMTGGKPELSGTLTGNTLPPPGEAGGPVKGVPPDLRPKLSQAVDQARALVAAHPDQPEAWATLGWALVEAEGWIDVYETARRLQELDPKDPDGLVLEASVRIAMTQRDAAQKLVTDALTLDPSHIQALSFQGALAMQRGDAKAAKVAWTQALRVAGPGNGFEDLVAIAESGGTAPALPKGHPKPDASGSGMPAGHPGANIATAGGGGERIEGRVLLAEGTSTPGGGVIFIIARPKGVQRGPPAAAKRLAAGTFPISFSISSADAMMGGALPPEVSLSARLDADGNAGTRSPEDLVAASIDVRTGSSGIELVLKAGP